MNSSACIDTRVCIRYKKTKAVMSPTGWHVPSIINNQQAMREKSTSNDVHSTYKSIKGKMWNFTEMKESLNAEE